MNPCPWCGEEIPTTEEPFIYYDVEWHENCFWQFSGTHPMRTWFARHLRQWTNNPSPPPMS